MKDDSKLKEVSRVIAKWQRKLNLDEWVIDAKLMKEPPEPESSTVGAGVTLAEVRPCPVYLQATVMIYPEFWKNPAPKREAALVHELVHCITQELFDVIRALWRDEAVSLREAKEKLERLTQRITYVAIHLDK